MKALNKHDKKMKSVWNETQSAKGFRKNDLIRQYNKMVRDRKEYLHHKREAYENIRNNQ